MEKDHKLGLEIENAKSPEIFHVKGETLKDS